MVFAKPLPVSPPSLPQTGGGGAAPMKRTSFFQAFLVVNLAPPSPCMRLHAVHCSTATVLSPIPSLSPLYILPSHIPFPPPPYHHRLIAEGRQWRSGGLGGRQAERNPAYIKITSPPHTSNKCLQHAVAINSNQGIWICNDFNTAAPGTAFTAPLAAIAKPPNWQSCTHSRSLTASAPTPWRRSQRAAPLQQHGSGSGHWRRGHRPTAERCAPGIG